MKAIWLFVIAGMFLTACGGSGTNSGSGSGSIDSKPAFEIRIEGAVVPMEVKSSWESQNSYTGYSQTPPPTTALHQFAIRNYAYDKPNGSIMASNEKLSAAGQVLVYFTLYGENGKSDEKTPVKVTTYNGGGTQNMTLERVLVYRFGEGKDDLRIIAFDSGAANNKGSVKITSVTGDTITGEIDVTGKHDGKDVSVKGPFTAKIYKPGM